MSTVRIALRKLIGLFVDDGWLAATTLGVVNVVGSTLAREADAVLAKLREGPSAR